MAKELLAFGVPMDTVDLVRQMQQGTGLVVHEIKTVHMLHATCSD